MISKKLQNKINYTEFIQMANYFGIAVHANDLSQNSRSLNLTFIDVEVFFLSATYNLKTSRMAEGFLCWLLEFGHLLSPSKIRRLIQAGQSIDQSILGGFIEFLVENNIKPNQWKIIRPFCKKKAFAEQLIDGPKPRLPSSYFLKYQIIAPLFELDVRKFLLPIKAIYKNCMELKNRALFGSIVNADVTSYLMKNPGSTPYDIAINTHHHKARVFEIHQDILAAKDFRD